MWPRRNALISEAMGGDEEPSTSEQQVPCQDFGGDGVNYYPHFQTTEIFPTYHEVSRWAKDVAKTLKFEIVHSYNSNGWLYLRCNRGARDRKKVTNPSVTERPNTSTQYCGCKFLIKARKLDDGEGWVIVLGPEENGKHNHELIVYKEGNRQMSGLSPGAKKLVQEMTSAGVQPKRILAAVNNQFPDDHPNRRHIYNFRDRLRRMDADGRDVVSHFLQLGIEASYTHWSQADPDTNVLTHTFMAHPTSIQLLRTYPWVIGIDSTYKTNRYKMPFLEIVGVTPCNQNFLIGYAFMKDETAASYAWVLDKLKLLLGNDVRPTAIVTDRELGLMRPIRELFPDTAHLLCTWHINKDVEHRVGKITKSTTMGEMFKNGNWRQILYATTEEAYDRAVTSMEDAWRAFPGVSAYVKATWLNEHRQKFVKCWTNAYLHFGNVNTCRVESAHNALKGWLDTSTGSLDSVWRKVNMAIEDQVIRIKNALEFSRHKHGRKFSVFPLQHLVGRTSLHCLGLLSDEIKRMRLLSDEVNIRCGCVYKTTHSIPCACDIHRAMAAGTYLYLEAVHPFWRTFVIGDDEAPVIQSEEPSTQDTEWFESLVSEIRNSDPAVMRYVSRLLDEHLHSDQSGFEEPVRNRTTRGRPSRSTRRDPSAWEYSSRGRGRGRSQSSGSGSRMDSTSGFSGMDISQFPFPNGIPDIIKPFLQGWNNVLGDGNCGFRCVADFFLGGQDNWQQARRIVANEVAAHRPTYIRVYHEGLDHGIDRITWYGGRCGQNHYMEMPQDLFPIANFWNCAVMLFGVGHAGELFPCMTVLPWQAPSTATQPLRDIAIAHIGNHYIRLDLSPDFPVPPIITPWFELREQSVIGWEQLYEDRRAMWDHLATIDS